MFMIGFIRVACVEQGLLKDCEKKVCVLEGGLMCVYVSVIGYFVTADNSAKQSVIKVNILARRY